MAEAKKENCFVRAGKRISRWFREMKSELKKVVWPTKSQMINNTLIVLACVLVVGVFIWVFDCGRRRRRQRYYYPRQGLSGTMAEAAKWYVVHTYSGYENTVKATIEKTVETRQLQDLIHVVSIPMETVTEITDNRRTKTYDRKVFPGYVLVEDDHVR